MAIVRSLEGTFYDIPEGDLEQYQVPPDQVKKLMESAGQKPPQGPGGSQQMRQPAGQGSQGSQGAQGSPQILVQFITQAAPTGQHGAGQHPTEGTGQKPPTEGGEESVEPQWYWVNWYNWANWYNWY
jgi:hypothetical protein